MTFKYWFKIVLGMLVIFTIGAFGVRSFRQGRDFLDSDRPLTLPLLSAPFRLGGEHLGKFQKVRIERSAPGSVSGLALTVALDQNVDASRFDGCSIAITDASTINRNTTFVCAVAADSSRLKLVPFGTITFRPGNQQVVLLVPQSFATDLQQNLAANDGGNDTGNVDVNGDSGSLHIRVNGKDIVSINGDSAGGSIKVFDGNGRPVVDIAGDSSGGHVMVKDANGNTKVNVKANNPPRKPPSP